MPVPMRDGTKLATNIWRPDADGPVPTLLVRNPYSKQQVTTYGYTSPNIFVLVEAGYAVAVQDTRGTFCSEGTFVPHVDDAGDGADTVAWLTEQDWCDGNVGSWGASYLGFVQWQTAATGVAGLRAMAPAVTSADLYRAPWHSPGGALSLDCLLAWTTLMSANELQRRLATGEGDPSDMVGLGAAMADLTVLSDRTPVAEQPLLGTYLPWVVDQVIGHPDRDATWEALSSIDRVGLLLPLGTHLLVGLGDTPDRAAGSVAAALAAHLQDEQRSAGPRTPPPPTAPTP
ncbi:CocE/NonD family hydrolase [Pseudonocardia sp. GCM10023141]|uniref:CocE/NonD family hydrolase n=1 Tax=Pseudonocardia sp. GCM10023141 TaxID=3252653 RepID=UPI00361DBC76